ncbi:hypothetical protein [Kribbella lupini]|uniref:Secreted protein n=1 Tax=Kribbella lupini TaxID=291602 RepID=A0ABN2ALU4_9ACTN
MGAALVIPLIVIVLAAVAYLVWTLFAAGRGAVEVAKSARGENSGETAAHTDTDDHSKIRDVSTKPPQE